MAGVDYNASNDGRWRLIRTSTVNEVGSRPAKDAGYLTLVDQNGNVRHQTTYIAGGLPNRTAAPLEPRYLGNKNDIYEAPTLKVDALYLGYGDKIAHKDLGAIGVSKGCICPKDMEGFVAVYKTIPDHQLPNDIEVRSSIGKYMDVDKHYRQEFGEDRTRGGNFLANFFSAIFGGGSRDNQENDLGDVRYRSFEANRPEKEQHSQRSGGGLFAGWFSGGDRQERDIDKPLFRQEITLANDVEKGPNALQKFGGWIAGLFGGGKDSNEIEMRSPSNDNQSMYASNSRSSGSHHFSKGAHNRHRGNDRDNDDYNRDPGLLQRLANAFNGRDNDTQVADSGQSATSLSSRGGGREIS